MADPSSKSVFADHIPANADNQALESGSTFAARLNGLLIEKGWKSADLARESGVPAKRISDYLKGPKVPSAEYLFPMAETLGASAEWLALGRNARRDGTALLSIDDADFEWVPRFDLREIRDDGKGPRVETNPFRKDWLQRTLGTSSELWLAALLSDYPPKGLEEGDLVFCREIEPQELAEGNVCLWRINGGIAIAHYSLMRKVEAVQGVLVPDKYAVTPGLVGTDEDMYIPIARILGKWAQRI